MKSFKVTISLLLLSSVSALAVETPVPIAESSLPMITAITSASKPAVDGMNGKVSVFGGAGQGNIIGLAGLPGFSPGYYTNEWKGIGGAIGTITVPLGHSFGAQIDLGSAVLANRPLGDARGHLFWRDPDKGMIGAYGSGMLYGDKVGYGVWTAAGEFEAYLGKFTGRAILGIQGTDAYTGNLSANWLCSCGGSNRFSVPNYFTDMVSATFYPLDDLALTVGHMYSQGRNAVTGKVEYLLPQFRGGNIAPSVYAEAGYGWNNSSTITAGIRVYFGNHDKTLIRRQREDDPDIWELPESASQPALRPPRNTGAVDQQRPIGVPSDATLLSPTRQVDRSSPQLMEACALGWFGVPSGGQLPPW